jgi:signal transduction histidine kinase
LAALFYIRLISLTAGTIVYLFLLALILGHRRPRRFERLLFLLTLSLFLMYAGGLLNINGRIQYGSLPDATRLLSTILFDLGAFFLLPLIWHSHVEYAHAVQHARVKPVLWALVGLMYLIALGELLGVALVSRIVGQTFGMGLLSFADFRPLGNLVICGVSAAVLQSGLLRGEHSENARTLGKWLFSASSLLSVILIVRFAFTTATPFLSDLLATATVVAAIFPGALLIYFALKRNFLDYGAQRNLVYALSATFLALLYLALVHRVSGWLAPVFPPEATASVLLFILIFLFEPIERVIGPVLHRRLSERMDHVQRVTLQIQQEARQASVAELVALAERRIREEFGLAAVRISVPRDVAVQPLEIPGGLGHAVRLPLMKDKQEIGLLEAVTTGAYITGETSAALEFLAEQLPAMFDLCRLIEEKLRLERELAGRERLALLGQMAASVSHNLRNPLSSMKTILQVQLEKPDLPFDIRHDCALVVGEIDRMSAKLTQLLKFAKPSVNGQRIGAVALAKQTAALFGRDAERRNVRLEFDCPAQEVWLLVSEEALSEVLSNLIINAIEAQPDGGRVRVGLTQTTENLEIRVEDDGPGISQEMRAQIFQPFFTTKATGTGLGLSIVARRVAEMGGEVTCESPVRNEKGTRLTVKLPAAIGKETTEDAVDSDRR